MENIKVYIILIILHYTCIGIDMSYILVELHPIIRNVDLALLSDFNNNTIDYQVSFFKNLLPKVVAILDIINLILSAFNNKSDNHISDNLVAFELLPTCLDTLISFSIVLSKFLPDAEGINIKIDLFYIF